MSVRDSCDSIHSGLFGNMMQTSQGTVPTDTPRKYDVRTDGY